MVGLNDVVAACGQSRGVEEGFTVGDDVVYSTADNERRG